MPNKTRCSQLATESSLTSMLLLNLLLMIAPASFADNNQMTEVEDTISLFFDCSSYMRFVNVDDHLQNTIDKVVAKGCGEGFHITVQELNFVGTSCDITYKFEPEKLLFLSKCAAVVREILENGTFLAWGHQWGCRSIPLEIAVTPYYPIHVPTTNMRNMGVEKLYSTQCRLPILQIDRQVDVVCSMTQYGGYRWVVKDMSRCVEPTLSNITSETIDVLIRSPIKCQLLIFAMFGVLYENVSTVLGGKKPADYVLDMLTEHCLKLSREEFEAAFSEVTGLSNYLLELTTTDYLQSNDGKRYLKQLTRILQLYTNYLVNYHGHLARFSMFESNFFVLQIPRDYRPHKSSIFPDFRIELDKDHPTTLVACTRMFRYVDLVYHGNRIIHGLCLVKIRSTMKHRYRIRFVNAQQTQIEHHWCMWTTNIDRDSERLSEPDRCVLESRAMGDLVCACEEEGIVSLVRRGTGEDDMRHVVFNPLGEDLPFILYLMAAGLVLIGTLFLGVLQSWPTAVSYVLGARKKSRHTRSNINCGRQMLLLSGIKIILLALTARYDDDDSCRYLGYAQITAFFNFELMNVGQAAAMFLLLRTHQPVRLLGQIEVIIYLCGISIGVIWQAVSPYETLNIQCLPQEMLKFMTIPFTTLNAAAISTAAIYVYCFKFNQCLELLGIVITSGFGLAQWSLLIPLVEPGKRLKPPIGKMSSLNVAQGLVLLTYHCFVKIQVHNIMEKLNKAAINSVRWMRQKPTRRNCLILGEAPTKFEADVSLSRSWPLVQTFYPGSERNHFVHSRRNSLKCFHSDGVSTAHKITGNSSTAHDRLSPHTFGLSGRRTP
ncbi:hypothetical protein T265_02394 [Opisthorchis viverrini]|uniref:Intimal thickness related receptor IRP domain-containing protein n=1 Tax=Opisthorchis viverrini TaxID=6198 RepID=A0A075A6R6_OPIVI|nr:hypothetical protein T265_02394 [Opisthorchis viverrini]KER31340.1 hypothetical protein T265_02394 [Opisthorchis viverrini]